MLTKYVWSLIANSLIFVTAAFAATELDSVFTIALDKNTYQMGEEIGYTWYIHNATKETLNIGDPNKRYGPGIFPKLIKKQTYGKAFFKSGEPQPWSESATKRAESFANKGMNVPPGYKNWGRAEMVIIPGGLYGHGLNPGIYSLQAICRGGPPPIGGWWSNVVKFEILEPKGEEGEAWKLLSDEINKIERPADSLEKAIDQSWKGPISSMEEVKAHLVYEEDKEKSLRDLLDMQAGPYRKIVIKYPNTNCAKVTVKHLERIYSRKINRYIAKLQYFIAEEEVKKVIPDSLRRYLQAEIERDKKEKIQRWGKEEFDKSVKEAKEQIDRVDEMRKEQKKNK